MSTTLIKLAHSVREQLSGLGCATRLGHTHQLLAASLGHKSLAVLQASGEPETLNSSMHWIVDLVQLRERTQSLNLTLSPNLFVNALIHASRACRGPRIHSSAAELAEHLMEEVQTAALHDEYVSAVMAETNCTGPWDVNLEVSSSLDDGTQNQGIVFDYEGHVQGEQDWDRPYSGDTANLKAQARLTLLGKCLAGPPKVEILDAELDDEYYEQEDLTPRQTLTQLEAIALELGLPITLSDELAGAEVEPHTMHGGASSGYVVNLEYCEASPVIDQLRANHPTQQIWVLGNAFERVSPFD